MKARVDQKQLADAAKFAFRRLDGSPAMPVLACLLLEAHGDTLTVSGSGRDASTRTVLEAEVLEPGSAVVSGRMLADTTAALSTGPVDAVGDEQQLILSAGGTRFGLPTADTREYPAPPAVPAVSGTVDGAVFAAAVADVAPAAMPMKDALGSVQGMGGIRVASEGERLTVSATNRYLIAQRTIPWSPNGADDAFMLVPEPVLAPAARGFDATAVLSLAMGPVAALSGGGRTLTARGIDAGYPNLAAFRPDPAAAVGTVDFDPEVLAAAAKRVALVNDADRPVLITVADDAIQVSGGHDGRTGTTTVPAVTDGDAAGFSIAFNPRYLASALTPAGDSARMWLHAPAKPVLIRPADGDPGYWAVLMPVRVPGN